MRELEHGGVYLIIGPSKKDQYEMLISRLAGTPNGETLELDGLPDIHPKYIRDFIEEARAHAYERNIRVIINTNNYSAINEFDVSCDNEYVEDVYILDGQEYANILDIHDRDWLAHFNIGSLHDRGELAKYEK